MSPSSNRRAAYADIDLSALRHNLGRVRERAPGSRVMAVVKADAYGHGMAEVVQALGRADAFAVATVMEAIALRALAPDRTVVALQGPHTQDEARLAVAAGIQVVIHAWEQLDLLVRLREGGHGALWLKVDTGMHRLGFAPEELDRVWGRLGRLAGVRPIGHMTHLARADEPGSAETDRQIRRFEGAVKGRPGLQSIANSGGVLHYPDSHRDWVRPGIMLYGCSPLAMPDQALKPVMTLRAPIVQIKRCGAGEPVGYGGAFICPEDMPVGVAGIGYADGYPRHAPNGTPVLVGGRQAPLAGRVSMDMITVDLRGIPGVSVGDEVVLWGSGLPVEEVARRAGTIGYELLCHAGCVAHKVYR